MRADRGERLPLKVNGAGDIRPAGQKQRFNNDSRFSRKAVSCTIRMVNGGLKAKSVELRQFSEAGRAAAKSHCLQK
jgi:hypothetical protein